MSRQLRAEVVNALYHVTQHAVGDEPFFRDVYDRFYFEVLLDRAVKRFRWDLHAYCQLDNHYHLLVKLTEPTLATGMQFLDGRYAQAFNQRHERRGALVWSRYGAKVVRTQSYYLECLAYIATNPVAAGLCRSPEEWEWGTFGARGTLGRRPEELLRHVGGIEFD